MPCRGYYDDHPEEFQAYIKRENADLTNRLSFVESALCATLKALKVQALEKGFEDNFYDDINFVDAGITKEELKAWHIKHMEQDALHRAQEQAKLEANKVEQQKELTKQAALAKLTEEEKKVLGISKS